MDTVDPSAVGHGPSPCGVVPSPDSEVSLTRASRTLGRDRREEAIGRVATYLRCIGLEDPARAQATATTLIDQIMAHPSCWLRNRAVSQALDIALGRIERWMDDLAREHWLSDGDWLPGEEGFTAHRIRTVIRQCPDRMLVPSKELSDQGLALGPATINPGPIFPPVGQAKMPRQQFGKLPTMFRMGFWQRIYRRWCMIGRVIVRTNHSPTTATEKQVA